MKVRNLCVALGFGASQVAALYAGIPRFARSTGAVRGIEKTEEPAAVNTGSAIKAYSMSVPIDHFPNETKYEPHSKDHFNLRYWADVSHYRKGGPVFIIHSGEFSGEGRLPFLEKGIGFNITQITGAVGIVLEHRYYGGSWPTENATTESYRFLTTEQAAADVAFFSKNLKIPGHDKLSLASPESPHILYGGSYAGGLVAIARKTYPDVFWGAISSSGVTAAIDDFWQYHEATRWFAPGECSPTIQHLTAIVDHALQHEEAEFKAIFGLRDLRRDQFAGYLADQLPSAQDTNWDPELDDTSFGTFCAVVTSNWLLFKSTEYLIDRVRRYVEAPGLVQGGNSRQLTMRMLNYIGYIKDRVNKDKAACKAVTDGSHQDPKRCKTPLQQCLSTQCQKGTTEISKNSWERSWLYQMCTEWGFFINGASTPHDRLAMIPRALTAKSASLTCEAVFGIKSRPQVETINKHGGFNFSYPRVAFIDGKQDPWRCAGVHADGLPDRSSTWTEPYELMDWGVHQWDENGQGDKQFWEGDMSQAPQQVANMQGKELEIVKKWLKEFRKHGPI
ncbi:extracelular serine carboxypeptidase [Metarhizium album ARSEF 1941]|uniref:Extracelular serine carboxypeptidase n=1 Tax=Metarhizium album (strain ARSEF 1941) TaxID=1081103 RepID=A0A0B2WIQ1_METAS|nr:extracelular serine carboxypeptidase [Metarhizium album ARSEF 1941]KHN95916.1 extracelular serine carboxypeptidase [Metarhizium album ARSEF 1941]